ncbi:hypothetical protein [Flavobacterium sp.]|uniref:hypothetical protein n=1 Tax=Flavobacterium sp. TaxID=239 RepID=UPI0040337D59
MKLISIIIITLLLLSCKQKQNEVLAEKESDTLVVYDHKKYQMLCAQNPENKIKYKLIDTACINGKKRAKEEAARGIYTFHYGAGLGFNESKMAYLKKAFSKKGITIDFYITSCIGGAPAEGEFGRHCYVTTAKEEFEKKYGRARIDSMEKASIDLMEKYRR